MAAPLKSTIERFLDKISVSEKYSYAETACWDWVGSLTNGYGQFVTGGKQLQAHRFSYEHYIGTIPLGFSIDHLCRNRACVNPKHLEAVTPLENNLRKLSNRKIVPIKVTTPLRAIDRFRLRVTESKNNAHNGTPCWEWTGSITKKGYGHFWETGKYKSSHRFSYEYFIGKIPVGLHIDHLCRVRNCVNPDHLEAVTNLENVKRGNQGQFQAIKTHCPKGHPYSGDNLYLGDIGHRSCKACAKTRAPEYRLRKIAKEPDYYKNKLAAWRIANKDRIREYNKTWWRANGPTRIAARRAAKEPNA